MSAAEMFAPAVPEDAPPVALEPAPVVPESVPVAPESVPQGEEGGPSRLATAWEWVRPGTTLVALVRGSVVLTRRLCGCAASAVGWAWRQARIDVEATAAAQRRADDLVQARAKKRAAEGDGQEEGEVRAAPVTPRTRPLPEAAGMIALGGLLAVGAAGTAGAAVWPYVQPYVEALAPWRGMIATAGTAVWMVAAWMVAPPPKPPAEEAAADADVQDAVVDGEAVDMEARRGEALLWHVLGELAAAERARRTGVHLDAVLTSAIEARLLADDTELAELRAWLHDAGLPTVDQLGMRIGGKPVTRVGLRVDAATKALGTSPAALLAARTTAQGEGPALGSGEGVARPSRRAGEGPAQAPARTPRPGPSEGGQEGPVPGLLRLIPGGRSTRPAPPSPTSPAGPAPQGR